MCQREWERHHENEEKREDRAEGGGKEGAVLAQSARKYAAQRSADACGYTRADWSAPSGFRAAASSGKPRTTGERALGHLAVIRTKILNDAFVKTTGSTRPAPGAHSSVTNSIGHDSESSQSPPCDLGPRARKSK